MYLYCKKNLVYNFQWGLFKSINNSIHKFTKYIFDNKYLNNL